MAKKAEQTIYMRDERGRAVLVAKRGEPLPPGYVPDDEPVELSSLTNDQLDALGAERGVDTSGLKKAEKIEALSEEAEEDE